MLARRSRKMRILDSPQPQQQQQPLLLPSILQDLTTPDVDGSIPLANFLGNMERFNADINLRVAELEEENAKYKQLFRQYEEKMDKIENMVSILAEDDDRLKSQKPPAGFRVKNPIYNYFGGLSKPPPVAESKLAKNIDELLRTNIDLMISHIEKIKGTHEKGTIGSILNPPNPGG